VRYTQNFLKQDDDHASSSDNNNAPSRVIIAFDLHRVLFTPRKIAMIWFLLRHVSLLSILRSIFNPFFWQSIWQLNRLTLVSDYFIDLLIQRYSYLAPYRETMMQTYNQQKLDLAVFNLAKELREQGHHLIIASNIGPRTLELLCDSFPQLCEFFEKRFTPTATTNWAAKPSLLYFDYLKKWLVHHFGAHERTLIIDDNQKNISAAQKAGLKGLHFINAQQTRKELLQQKIIERSSIFSNNL
jgi:FMN phosphatase YigB (HAD superfamily)